MANNVQTKAETALTPQEISDKYNGGRRILDFVGKKKIFFGVSLGIILIGIICNFIFGTTLDIQFSGGSILTYSYRGDINQDKLRDFIQDKTDDSITAAFSSDMAGGTGNSVTVQFAGKNAMDRSVGATLTAELQKEYPDAKFELLEENSVDASMGHSFLLKCLVAVALASVLLLLPLFLLLSRNVAALVSELFRSFRAQGAEEKSRGCGRARRERWQEAMREARRDG